MLAVSTSETDTETLIHEYSRLRPRPGKCVFLRPRPGKWSRLRVSLNLMWLLYTFWAKLELLGPKP